MAIQRPTFHESWYRVADLKPRLLATVQVHRQHFRGQMWYVLEDASNNQYFRLNIPAYRFVGLLDGEHTIGEVWRICNEQLGDQAPTQGEAIQLLGQLYASNLLQAELPPDTEGLFRRYRKRRVREIQSYLTNLLFIRIPLIDPDHFLDRWVALFGKIFAWYGGLAWLVLIGAGLYSVAGHFSELADRSQGILSPSNLPLLYGSMVLVKILHEFGHGFACKHFGRVEGGRGEVHIMGVMFLVFTPLPYVDASSASAFRSKWRRVMVGFGGMYVELALAAVAAIIWASTRDGSPIHAVAYNVMFIASVTTLLFNGNPLLRYDAYYILSDLLEIPNLSNRSKEYIYYLVKKYVWGVKHVRNPAHSAGEKRWFAFYGIASSIYRLFILFSILLFLTDRLPEQFKIIAILFAVVSGAIWMCVPIGKLVHYLATSGELMRVRPRAVLTTVLFFLMLIVGVGFIKAPHHDRVEGVVEPVKMAVVFTETEGFLEEVLLPSNVQAPEKGTPLLRMTNVELERQYAELLARREGILAQRSVAEMEEPAAVQIANRQLVALDEQIAKTRQDIDNLIVRAPLAGAWVSPQIDQMRGAYLKKGERVGIVAAVDSMMIRAVADQQTQGLLSDASDEVDIRVKGRADIELAGRITKIMEAATDRLPSEALGLSGGGEILTEPTERGGQRPVEGVVEIHVRPNADAVASLHSGQRVVVRLSMSKKPLIDQWMHALMQLLQRRFGV